MWLKRRGEEWRLVEQKEDGATEKGRHLHDHKRNQSVVLRCQALIKQ